MGGPPDPILDNDDVDFQQYERERSGGSSVSCDGKFCWQPQLVLRLFHLAPVWWRSAGRDSSLDHLWSENFGKTTI